jgi:REP element-mobilizing transposase RayT
LVARIKLLAEAFAIDVCAYAVMSNHCHLVLHLDEGRARRWNDEEVGARLGRIFPRALAGIEQLAAKERRDRLALWRERLASLSWFMRCLNEPIAREANQEDGCTGRFWEGRFRSQALLDDGALLACMSYVDLNPVRAGMATSLGKAAFTSIKERLAAVSRANKGSQPCTPAGLAPMVGERAVKAAAERERLPIALGDYVDLLEWTGRALREGSRGRLSGPPVALLARTGLSGETWLANVRELGTHFGTVVGAPGSVERAAAARGLCWCQGKRRAGQMYAAA